MINVPIELGTVRFIARDGRYVGNPGGIGAFSNLTVFTCRDRWRHLGGFQHHVLLAYYKEVRLPDEFCFFSKLKCLELSSCSYFYLPGSWKNIKNLRKFDLSCNQSLLLLPHWVGHDNRYTSSVNVMGCSRFNELH